MSSKTLDALAMILAFSSTHCLVLLAVGRNSQSSHWTTPKVAGVILAASIPLLLAWIIWFRRRPVRSCHRVGVGEHARATEPFVWSGDGYRGRVLIDGKARSAMSPRPLKPEQVCEVTRAGRTALIVEPTETVEADSEGTSAAR